MNVSRELGFGVKRRYADMEPTGASLIVSNRLVRSTLVVALVLCPLAALAQAPAAPSAETLRVARELVAKITGDRGATLNSIAGPMVGMMQQMGIKQQDRAQALVQEALMPILTAHYDDLLAIHARSYAAVLSVADMKSIATFYDTPAGQSLIRAQPQLAQATVTGMTEWITGLQPEMQGKIQQTIQAHGWDKG